MKREYPEPIRIRVGQSATLAVYLHLLHLLLALFCLFFTPGILYPLLLLVLVLVSWIVLSIRYHISYQPVVLGWLPEGGWTLREEASMAEETLCLRDSFVHHRLIILRFARGRFGSRCFLLLPDNCDMELHRQLRVRFRHELTRSDRAAGNYPGS